MSPRSGNSGAKLPRHGLKRQIRSMGWAKERWTAFSEGVGARRFAIGAIFAAVVAAADHIKSALRHPGMIFNFPSWTLGVFVLAIIVSWWLLEYAVKLRRQLKGAADLRGCLGHSF